MIIEHFRNLPWKLITHVIVLLSGSAAIAQQQTIQGGVYTEAQAQMGRIHYEESCQHCHDHQFFENRLMSFTGMTVLDFWYAMFKKMPADNPGSLEDTEYLEIIAYVLSENGFPAGNAKLVPSNQLGRIRILTRQ